jgi:hypothetical protein
LAPPNGDEHNAINQAVYRVAEVLHASGLAEYIERKI